VAGRREHLRSELDDEATLLRHADERVGEEDRLVPLPDPGQGLEAGYVTGGQIDDRLVIREQALFGQSLAQQVLGGGSLRLPLAQGDVEDLGSVPTE
jgi:hypothetical protein